MKVLIVEDNDNLRKSLLDYIRDEGFAADAAADGEEGLYKAVNWEYDLIVLDVMLPKLDGWEIIQRLRQRGKSMPVLMLTARDGLEDRIKGLNCGADDYLVKPFEMEELTARMRAILRRANGSASPVLNVGPIQLNTANRLVFFFDEVIVLTAREYALLEILMMHHDTVVTREFLYEHLFDERDETLSNMLDVYIYKLRQKFGKERLLTRRGMGYMLVSDVDAPYAVSS